MPRQPTKRDHRFTGYLIYVGLTGAAVLAIELLGSRVIAPYYGNTIVIWTALITITLIALATGYVAGGWLIDRRPGAGTLHAAVAFAGAWLILVQLIRHRVMDATLGMGITWGAILSTTVLFLPPLLLLGAIGPMVIRLNLTSLERAGRVSGMVYAASTMGSVVGAVLTGFVLVQFVSTSRLILGIACVLIMLAGIGLIAGRRRHLGAAVCFAGVLVTLLAGPEPARPSNVPYSVRTPYGKHLVIDSGAVRYLATDGCLHTAVHKKTKENLAPYVTCLELLPFMRPAARRSLHIGLGGGALSTIFDRHYGIVSDVVEIDPAMATIARRYFGYEPSGEIHFEDGRTFFNHSRKPYDLIILDVFNTDRQPWYLFTQQYFDTIQKHLAPKGILAINAFGFKSGPGARGWRSIIRTLRMSFSNVTAYLTRGHPDANEQPINVVIFASVGPLQIVKDLSESRAAVREDLERFQRQQVGPATPEAEGVLLTDDFNPLDRLTAPVFVALRRANVAAIGAELLAE